MNGYFPFTLLFYGRFHPGLEDMNGTVRCANNVHSTVKKKNIPQCAASYLCRGSVAIMQDLMQVLECRTYQSLTNPGSFHSSNVNGQENLQCTRFAGCIDNKISWPFSSSPEIVTCKYCLLGGTFDVTFITAGKEEVKLRCCFFFYVRNLNNGDRLKYLYAFARVFSLQTCEILEVWVTCTMAVLGRGS